MNNYYELKKISAEFEGVLPGSTFEFAISPHKDVMELFLRSRSESKRLIFSSNPSETALFLDQYRPPKKNNVIEFFKGIEGEKITGVELARQDRLIYLYLQDGTHLLFKLFSNSPNVYLVRDGIVSDAFKNPDRVTGNEAPQPFTPEFAEGVNPKAKPKNQVTRLNPLLPRNLLPPLLEQHRVDEMSPEEVEAFVERITRELEENPDPRVLVTGETCLWSRETLDIATESSFSTVNDTIRHAYRNAVHTRRMHQAREGVLKTLKRSLAKRESTLEELHQADKSLDRADRYEKYGHLLMSHAHEEIAPDRDSLKVDDLYEEGETVTIPLSDGRDIAGNAQYYYRKAKESRTSYEKAVARIGRVEDEIEELKELIDAIGEKEHLPELQKWIKKHGEKLEQYGYGGTGQQQATSPFRKLEVDGYELWIGKSAKSNDQLLGVAHKEDIWMHARGVAGSHAVIRMGNRKDFPQKRILLQAASHAAYYSKARGMKSAPVMYTKVKYVRKPKGAPPGAVVVEREEVELVPPLKPQSG